MLGKFQAAIETKDKITTATMYVSKGKRGNLLFNKTSVNLQIIPDISSLKHSKADELCRTYKSVFTGTGKLKDTKTDLHLDTSVQPVTQPHRRIPFHIREKVQKELKRLEDLDIIEMWLRQKQKAKRMTFAYVLI